MWGDEGQAPGAEETSAEVPRAGAEEGRRQGGNPRVEEGRGGGDDTGGEPGKDPEFKPKQGRTVEVDREVLGTEET